MTTTEAVADRAYRGAGCSAGFLPPELQKLLATAALVIDRHVNAAGRCRACQRGWPCERARLADLVLGGF